MNIDVAIKQLLGTRQTWLEMPPELAELLPLAIEAFRDMISRIPEDHLVPQAGREFSRCQWHVKTGPAPTEDPDDGIFVKDESVPDRYPTTHGRRPDNKLTLQVRRRTRRLFKYRYKTEPDGFRPETHVFFDLAERIMDLRDAWIEAIITALVKQNPALKGISHRRDLTTLRFMIYRRVSADCPGVAGQYHVDKNDITIHMADSCPGLLVRQDTGEYRLIPTRPGWAYIFTSKRFKALCGLEPLLHGAQDNGARAVCVSFVHFWHPGQRLQFYQEHPHSSE